MISIGDLEEKITTGLDNLNLHKTTIDLQKKEKKNLILKQCRREILKNINY